MRRPCRRPTAAAPARPEVDVMRGNGKRRTNMAPKKIEKIIGTERRNINLNAEKPIRSEIMVLSSAGVAKRMFWVMRD